MKWIVLSDNRSNDSRLSTEHGLSILLQTERHKILLDTGVSDVIIGSGYHVNPKILGYQTCTYIGIKLEKGSMYSEVDRKSVV